MRFRPARAVTLLTPAIRSGPVPENDDLNPCPQLSIFDLDRTITRRGTWSPFLLFAASRLAPWRLALIPCVVVAMGSYKLGLISRKELKEFMHAAMVGHRITEARMAALASQYADRVIAKNAYPEALKLIRAEQISGRTVIIATASHHFYAGALAKRLGVESVVATQSQRDGDGLTHKISGENCYGSSKLTMIEESFRRNGIDRAWAHIRFYSDDVSDLPTFDWADEPIAVNPSRVLRWHAMRGGWAILDWRQKDLRRNSASRASLGLDPAPMSVASP
jgi:HAD superfamily hydrolase (TIGR01490 family)